MRGELDHHLKLDDGKDKEHVVYATRETQHLAGNRAL
jgi:hypothetical protein